MTSSLFFVRVGGGGGEGEFPLEYATTYHSFDLDGTLLDIRLTKLIFSKKWKN